MNIQWLKEEWRDAIKFGVSVSIFVVVMCVVLGVFLITIAIAISMFGIDTKAEDRRRDKFMTECIQDHKRYYECEVLWRQAQPSADDAVIVPMPIVVPR